MQAVNFNNETLKIQDANSEIQQKIREYFTANGLTHEGQYGSIGPDLCAKDDYAFYVDGRMGSIEVNITYCEFKTKKQVQRDILALDERIDRVNLWRNLSYDEYDNQLSRLSHETIYVMIDGQLMQTTLDEWVNYNTRNIDYTKKRNGRMA